MLNSLHTREEIIVFFYIDRTMNRQNHYDMLRVATATPEVKVADPKTNCDNHLSLIHQAEKEEVQLLVFPELSLTGYTCGDLFFQPALLESAIEALHTLCCQTQEIKTAIVVGLSLAFGNCIYDVAAVLHKGTVKAFVVKDLLASLGERRWFGSGEAIASGAVHTSSLLGNVPIGTDLLCQVAGVTIGFEMGEDGNAPIAPSALAAMGGALVIVNPTACYESVGQYEKRRDNIVSQSSRLSAAYISASAGVGESTSDLLFAGRNLVVEAGNVLSESTPFAMQQQMQIADVDISFLQTERQKHSSWGQTYSGKQYRIIKTEASHCPNVEQQLYRVIEPNPFILDNEKEMEQRGAEIFNIQAMALASRLAHIHASTAIIGISGGLDSTLALLVTVEAFDRLNWSRERIVGITMPGFGTSGRTYTNSLSLMKSLGITQREISIVPSVTQHFADLGIDNTVHDVTYENSQARERTQILMDAANQVNGIVVGTGDLSELALGWCTYNGDHMSMYAVNADVPKTLVKSLVTWIAKRHCSEETQAILLDIVDTPISPELIPTDSAGDIAQKTEDLVGPYELHDFFLYHVIRRGTSPSKLYFLARKAWGKTYEEAILKKWIRNFFRRFFMQQFKRSCMPDGPKVGSVGLSPRGDWQMPSDAHARIWLDECDQL